MLLIHQYSDAILSKNGLYIHPSMVFIEQESAVPPSSLKKHAFTSGVVGEVVGHVVDPAVVDGPAVVLRLVSSEFSGGHSPQTGDRSLPSRQAKPVGQVEARLELHLLSLRWRPGVRGHESRTMKRKVKRYGELRISPSMYV